jgi:tuberculosinol/isotuberculosinol synthase
MDREAFLDLPVEEIAQRVREFGPKVCVFPINGTRRWFVLEHPELASAELGETYLRITGQRHIELYRLFFDHGIQTLLTPIFGPDLLARGDDYEALLERGLLWFAQDQAFLDFYDAYGVRVRIYGDARRHLVDSPFAPALDAYDELVARTACHQNHRLFFGVCAHDAAETVARIGIRFQEAHGRPPSKREIVEAYYGEWVEPVDLFIGFADRPAVFDMPLVTTGSEDLYFTVSPSLYLNVQTLRLILYDQMFARQVDDADYGELSPADWQTMEKLYTRNNNNVLGLGRRDQSGTVWYPTPQVDLPSEMTG